MSETRNSYVCNSFTRLAGMLQYPCFKRCFEPTGMFVAFGYNINVLQQTACLVVNPITVGNFAFLFNCTPVGRTSDSMMVQT